MHFRTVIIAAIIAGADAFPNNLIARQGVTAAISPSSPAPSGCSISYSGSFGIAVQSITVGAPATTQTAAVSQVSDGQPQVSSSAAGVSVAPVSQITDGQIQASSVVTLAPVSQITDGQLQATKGVTVMTMGMISMISDGQIQAPVTHAAMTVMPVSQITDGQIQAPKSTPAPVSQISDGQVQAPKATPVAQISDGQIQASKAAPVTQISDGQVQAGKTTVAPVSQISDGQPQASKATATAVSQISDGQPQATAVSQVSDGQPQATGAAASSPMMGLVACVTDSTLALTLSDGILLDSKGRTGYIASNYQFQFDKPAQAGAIYTAGFSVCSNGSLALGGSAVFYQCLSGSFYNLYSTNWAPQCVPVLIETLMLESC